MAAALSGIGARHYCSQDPLKFVGAPRKDCVGTLTEVYLGLSGWLVPYLFPAFRAHIHRLRTLHEPQVPHMSPNAASAQPDKQSLDYIIRSGVAGGIAGCVVSRVGCSGPRRSLHGPL